MTVLDLLKVTKYDVYIRTDRNKSLLAIENNSYADYILSNELKNAKIIDLGPAMNGEAIIITIDSPRKEGEE